MKSLIVPMVVCTVLSLTGCSSFDAADVNGVATGGAQAPGAGAAATLEFETVDRSSEGPWMEACAELFTSEEAWNEAMSGMAARGALAILPGPEAPSGVDWKHESVALVTLGELGSGSAGVEVRGAHRQGTHVVFDVEVTPPGPYAYVTAPYHIIKFRTKGIRSIEVRVR